MSSNLIDLSTVLSIVAVILGLLVILPYFINRLCYKPNLNYLCSLLGWFTRYNSKEWRRHPDFDTCKEQAKSSSGKRVGQYSTGI